MIKLKGLGAAEDLNGFMDEGTEFLGELRFRNVLRIDGRVKGKIVSDNTLIVGESGHVEADIGAATCGRDDLEPGADQQRTLSHAPDAAGGILGRVLGHADTVIVHHQLHLARLRVE